MGRRPVSGNKVTPPVLVVQTAVPAYRVGLFDELDRRLDGRLLVVAGDRYFERSVRTVEPRPRWLESIGQRYLLGRRLLVQWLPWSMVISPRTAVLVEANPRILTTWLLLLVRWLRGTRTACWGHATSRGAEQPRLARRLMLAVGGRAVAYTEADGAILETVVDDVVVAPNALYSSSSGPTVTDPPSDDVVRVVMIGRLAPDKEPMTALRAIAECRRQGLPVRLTVVGDGPEREQMECHAAGLGVADAVDFLGGLWHPDDLQAIYRGAACALGPGYVGLSIVQSHWFGVPLVYNAVAPHSPEISLAVDGFDVVVDEPSAAAWARAIQQAATRSLPDRHRVAEQTRAEHSMEAQAAGLAKSLESQGRACGAERVFVFMPKLEDGHRREYVRHIESAAQRRGQTVDVAVERTTLRRQMREARKNGRRVHLILPDGDGDIPALGRLGLQSFLAPRCRMTVLILRSDSRGALGAIKRLVLAVVRALGARIVRLGRGWDAETSSPPEAVAPDPLTLAEEADRLDARSRVPNHGRPSVGFVGRIDSRRGGDRVLAVHRRRPDLPVLLWGRWALPQGAPQPPTFVEQDQITDAEFDAFLEQLNVALLLYRNEGPSGVLNKCLALGTPVVTTLACDLPGVVRLTQAEADDPKVVARAVDRARQSERTPRESLPTPEDFAAVLLVCRLARCRDAAQCHTWGTSSWGKCRT